MITPITNPSALSYWLQTATSCDPAKSYAEIAALQQYTKCTNEDTLRDARIYHMDPPLNILFPNDSARNGGKDFVCHVIPKNLYPDSFIELTKSLYIISPELSFLQAAEELSLPEAVELANNLCGIYRKDLFSPYGQINRTPVTTVKKLSEYIDCSKNVNGVTIARKALKFALDNSNSPRESSVAGVFRLPMCLGGGAMSDISLNQEIVLVPQAADWLGRETCRCDIVSNSVKVVFEYDSDMAHLDRNQHSYDSRRSSALQMSGYTVITITADDFRSHLSTDKLILSCRNALGLRTHMDRFEKYRDIRWEVIDKIIYHKR